MTARKKDTEGFKKFWDAYGLKRDRSGAEKAWNRLTVSDRKKAMAGIDAYRRCCQCAGIAMKYAQGYLNNRRWEDDMEETEILGFGARQEQGEAVFSDMDKW